MGKEKFNDDAFLDDRKCPYCGHGEQIAGPPRVNRNTDKVFRVFVCASCGKMFEVFYEPTSVAPKKPAWGETTSAADDIIEGLEDGLAGGIDSSNE